MIPKNEYLIIPPQFHEEADSLAEFLRSLANRSNVTDPEEIKLIRPRSTSVIDFGEIVQTVLYLGAGSTSWFTIKWCNEYIWPEINKRIEKPSKKVIEWLVSQIEEQD